MSPDKSGSSGLHGSNFYTKTKIICIRLWTWNTIIHDFYFECILISQIENRCGYVSCFIFINTALSGCCLFILICIGRVTVSSGNYAVAGWNTGSNQIVWGTGEWRTYIFIQNTTVQGVDIRRFCWCRGCCFSRSIIGCTTEIIIRTSDVRERITIGFRCNAILISRFGIIVFGNGLELIVPLVLRDFGNRSMFRCGIGS